MSSGTRRLAETELTSREMVDACFQSLLDRLVEYRPQADVDLVRRAYGFAYKVHERQLRQSGEMYIAHPVKACHILADIQADEICLAACLLHDTVEDCAQDEEREVKAMRLELEGLHGRGSQRRRDTLVSEIGSREGFIERLKEAVSHELQEEFGELIFSLVAGVTRLSSVRYYELAGRRPIETESESEKQRDTQRLTEENYRRMVLAAAQDVRVLIIKLADRLHNMQTLYAKRRSKQIKIAHETQVIYAKLADRLGIWRIKWEMEDLAFRYLHPQEFFEVEQRVAKTRDERMADIQDVVEQIRVALEADDVPATVYGRPKHLWSIFTKMQSQGLSFSDIWDLEAIRIITNEPWHCYKILYRIHSMWTHQPDKFADYISNPKPNGYQSLHTKLIIPGHGPMEVQIRTEEMHRSAEFGVAAHWHYKETDAVRVNQQFSNKLAKLRQLFDIAQSSKPVGLGDEQDQDDELTESSWQQLLEEELSDNDIFVFTPNGDLFDMPEGATVVDFAYRIHTEVGHTCVGATVNRRVVTLNHVLQNGDQVKIETQRGTGPSRDWLKFVRTGTARNRIRQYFRRQERKHLIERGQQMLAEQARHLRVDLDELNARDQEVPPQYRRRDSSEPTEDLLTRIARRRGYHTAEDLLVAVADGISAAEGVIQQMMADLASIREAAGLEVYDPHLRPDGVVSRPTTSHEQPAVMVQKLTNVQCRRSRCCLPVPGDEIGGYVTRGAGVALHRADCVNFRHLRQREPGRVTTVTWAQVDHAQTLYEVPMEIRANDRIGLLRDVTTLLSELGINILGIWTKSPGLHEDGRGHIATMSIDLEVANRGQLEQLARRLPEVGVLKVTVRGQIFYDAEKGKRRRRPSESKGKTHGTGQQPGKRPRPR